MINIVIAEDHNSLIDGIDIFFKFEEDITIIGKVNDGSALLDFLESRNRQVNIVIVDIRMPKLNGIEATKQIKEKYPHIKIIAFTMIRKREVVNKMITAGVKGYLLKNVSLPTLREAIRVVYNGETYYDADLSLEDESSTTEIKKEKLLTKRQNQILDLIGKRFSNKKIAEKLFISEHTVTSHRKNMIEKLNLKGRDALLSYALNRDYDL
ncbi:Two-component system response regulatory protein, LuxR family [Tenacibaculum maritimum]|uniref:response regulator n=1 Tax=Tenacibaculum maritimum TaxID=107401 RepID=UPI0012E5DF68|nr:response regulator transcription factor [Tenacibaculum maritimum]CAA0217035.1 Two-component system response regulatory protein, LuxR family [Tenacibaculum maritimum]